ATGTPYSPASSAAAIASRDLPIPGSPLTSTSRPAPSDAATSAARSCPSSGPRPTIGPSMPRSIARWPVAYQGYVLALIRPGPADGRVGGTSSAASTREEHHVRPAHLLRWSPDPRAARRRGLRGPGTDQARGRPARLPLPRLRAPARRRIGGRGVDRRLRAGPARRPESDHGHRAAAG